MKLVTRARSLTMVFTLTLSGALATAAPAIAATGSIGGTVTDAISEAGVGNVEACAVGPFFGPIGECTETNGAGSYTIAGLQPSSYKVVFAQEGAPNYLEQWYPDKPSKDEAEPVSVGEGASVTGIDAKLQAGGQITGSVTDAVTHLPVKGVDVCAPSVSPAEITHCGQSDSSGEYQIHSLPTSSYNVEFFVERSPNYIRQYYPGKASWSEAEPFSVTAGATTPNIDAAMQEGVQITGRITEADSGEPIDWIVACALNPITEAQVGCSSSTPHEEDRYSIAGLPLGSYVVGFSIDHEEDGMVLHPDEYVRQYYDGKPTFAEATLVGGSAGAYPGIDAQLVKGREVFPEKITPSFTPPPSATVSVDPKRPRPLRCRKGFVKRRVHSKPKCVRATHHKPKHKVAAADALPSTKAQGSERTFH